MFRDGPGASINPPAGLKRVVKKRRCAVKYLQIRICAISIAERSGHPVACFTPSLL